MLNLALDEPADHLLVVYHELEPQIHVRLEVKGRHGSHIRAESAHIIRHILGPRTALGNVAEAIHVVASQLDKGYLVFIREQAAPINASEIKEGEVITQFPRQDNPHIYKELGNWLRELQLNVEGRPLDALTQATLQMGHHPLGIFTRASAVCENHVKVGLKKIALLI